MFTGTDDLRLLIFYGCFFASSSEREAYKWTVYASCLRESLYCSAARYCFSRSLTIDIINQRGHIFFVLKTCLQNIHMASCIQIRLANGFKRYLLVFVLQVLIEKHGVVTLFLSLNLIPVGKAVKPDFLEIVWKIEIRVCGIEFLIYLLIDKRMYFFVHLQEPPY